MGLAATLAPIECIQNIHKRLREAHQRNIPQTHDWR